MDWLGDLLKEIIGEWPIVKAAPLLSILVLAVGLIIGWTAAWLILRQRLIHHKELVAEYKEAAQKKGAGRAKATQAPPQPTFSLPQMLFGVGVIAILALAPSLFVYSQIKNPAPTASRVTIGNLFPFSYPSTPDLTSFNIEYANTSAVPINRFNLQLDGELTEHSISDQNMNDRMAILRNRLEEEEGTGAYGALDVGQRRVVTIANVSATPAQIAQFNKGELLLYVFSIVDWSDSSLSASEYWHLEVCGFFQGTMNILHTCPKVSTIPEKRVRN